MVEFQNCHGIPSRARGVGLESWTLWRSMGRRCGMRILHHWCVSSGSFEVSATLTSNMATLELLTRARQIPQFLLVPSPSLYLPGASYSVSSFHHSTHLSVATRSAV